MGTCTKKDLIREVANRTGLDITTVRDNIQCMFDTMCDGLEQDGNIEIRNFGIFRVKQTPPRGARNPRTGETIQVPAKKLIHFKPGNLMKKRINHQDEVQAPVPEPVAIQQAQPAPQPVSQPEQKDTPVRPQRPARTKPISRDKAQPAIILLSRPVND